MLPLLFPVQALRFWMLLTDYGQVVHLKVVQNTSYSEVSFLPFNSKCWQLEFVWKLSFFPSQHEFTRSVLECSYSAQEKKAQKKTAVSKQTSFNNHQRRRLGKITSSDIFKHGAFQQLTQILTLLRKHKLIFIWKVSLLQHETEIPAQVSFPSTE